MANIKIVRHETAAKTQVSVSARRVWMKTYATLPLAAEESGALGLVARAYAMILQRDSSGDGLDMPIEGIVDEEALRAAGFIETQII